MLQRELDVILGYVCWQFAMVHLDAIFVFSKFSQDFIEKARRKVRLPYEARATLKLKECRLFLDTIDYLGHINLFYGQELAGHITGAVTRLQHSTAQKDYQSFLGLCNAWRWLAPNVARLAASVNKN